MRWGRPRDSSLWLARCFRPLTTSRFQPTAIISRHPHISPHDLVISRRPVSSKPRFFSPDACSQALSKFLSALQSGNNVQLRGAYHNICRLKRSEGTLESPHWPSSEHLLLAMQQLSKGSSRADLELVEELLHDLASLFNLPANEQHYAAFVEAIIRQDGPREAMSRLLEYPTSISHWNLVFKALAEQHDTLSFSRLFASAIGRGLHPDRETYNSLLNCMSAARDATELAQVFDSLDQSLATDAGRSSFSREFWPSLIPRIRKLASHQALETDTNEILTASDEVIPVESSQSLPTTIADEESDSSESPETADHRRFYGTLKALAASRKRVLNKNSVVDGVIAMIERKIKADDSFKGSPLALHAAAHAAQKISELKRIADTLACGIDAQAWTILINNVLDLKGISAALEIYDEAKANVVPTSAMTHSLLRALCSGKLRSSSEPRFERIMSIYRELLQCHLDNQSSEPPDAQVYNIILQMLTSAHDTSATLPIAFSLLRDMQRYSVSFEPAAALSLLVLLIKASSSHATAFEVYTLFQEQYPDILDPERSTTILNAFGTLSFVHQRFTPPSLFFLMLNDMQRRGLQLSGYGYTIILSQISRSIQSEMSNKSPANLASSENALDAIRQIHRRLVLDTALSPDTPLLNALMNAYNHAGSIRDAIQVWETLYLQGKYDNTSVSIILDACGHNDALQVGASLMSRLHREGFQLDRGNWISWLEVLCRARKFEEALRLVCFDMVRSSPPIMPDERTVSLLLKFAWDAGKRKLVQERIKKSLPDLWKELSIDMKI
ncbi:hypothetical protein SISSUDRAFT_996774 [Sistotremastrum suecicum HHB10207 ss-3]|uniref:Pentacotripeptide-repeat region of PRORP domain-containing protein n=1 Tax=Sistotremastrum suecicum HHB10207 ss-3 TaxID=1314776 RepID=A0A166IIX1_9AGAM|nr:hypothetical protein SISSUDRAFT_996774 [Sistotremastrum suecicum HHB10207 ss-3]